MVVGLIGVNGVCVVSHVIMVHKQDAELVLIHFHLLVGKNVRVE